MPSHSRRCFLAAAALTGLAGCFRPESASLATDAPDPTVNAATSAAPTATPTKPSNGGPPSADELDLREANVIGVDVTDEGGRRFQFTVTLHHDDDGEDGYANWWQVETREGERLGRRELTHPHSQQPFTRAATISVPDGIDCVVVRGHDQTHGYGGLAMLVRPASGETASVSQGSEPTSMADTPCLGD